MGKIDTRDMFEILSELRTTEGKLDDLMRFAEDGLVKPVRCRECKHGELTKNGVGQAVVKCWQICELCGTPRLVERDWYCSDGERREPDA